MNAWSQITARSIQRATKSSPRTLDAAFAQLDEQDLRLEAAHEKPAVANDLSQAAGEMLSTIRQQLAAIDAQRAKLAGLLSSLS